MVMTLYLQTALVMGNFKRKEHGRNGEPIKQAHMLVCFVEKVSELNEFLLVKKKLNCG